MAVPQPTHQPPRQRTDTRLRSSATPLLIQPFARTGFAKRSFRCAASSVWNSLPASVIGSDSLSVFKSRLGLITFLFRRSFNQFTQSTAASASEVTTLWRFTKYVYYYYAYYYKSACAKLIRRPCFFDYTYSSLKTPYDITLLRHVQWKCMSTGRRV